MTTMHCDIRPMELRWRGRRLRISTPLDFRGDPGGWMPEHILVAGTANCLMTTFLALADGAQLPVIFYRARAGAGLEKLPGKESRFTRIILEPEIGVAAEDVERAQEVFGEAEKKCLFSQSLRTVVQVEPRFVAVAAEALPLGA